MNACTVLAVVHVLAAVKFFAVANVFDLPGPDFLRLFLLLIAGFVAVAVVMATLTRASAVAGPGGALDPYETAYLVGGPRRVALLAVSRLVDCGAATLAGARLRPAAAWRFEQHPVERRLAPAGGAELKLAEVPRRLAGDCDAIRRTLQAQGLLAGDDAMRLYRVAVSVAFVAVLVVGLVKCAVGLSRGRPIELLVMLEMVLVAAAAIALFRPTFRTTAGSAHVRALRGGLPRAGVDAVYRRDRDRGDASEAVALWGLAALAGHEHLGDLRRLEPPVDSSGGDAGGGHGCSSGGGGCGGGGGGGGCGGCGGGGH